MRAHRRPTLSDVASQAGVSVTTASYILNRRSLEMRISAPTAERVLAVAAALDYRPNRSARNLRTASTATIGLISDHVASGGFASRMITGAAGAARSRHHLLVIGESEGDAGTEQLLIEEMLDRQVDGILYATLSTSLVHVPLQLRDQRVVLLNCEDADGRLPAVVPDELAAGRAAAGVLLETGHRLGIYLVGEDGVPEAVAPRLRPVGITAALHEAGVALAGVVSCSWDVVPAHGAVGRFLDDGGRPAAMICLNDRIAMGTYEALREHGLRVPDDVAVVSFDGSALAGWLQPPLTSVVIPYEELGAVAVDRLVTGATGVERLAMPVLRGASTR